MGGQSGCLTVEGSEGPCGLWIAGGRVVHAETRKSKAMDAALEIAQILTGRFEFTPGAREPERSLDASATEVILEATRLMDEATAR
jgi:hypothetical protein